MRGDGMEGLAIAIFVASLLLVLAPAGVLGAIAWYATKSRVAAGAAGFVGLGVGVLIVIATFFESTWSPPITIHFDVPAEFAHEWVVLIKDEHAPNDIVWTGSSLPFSSPQARLAVAKSGVVRVRDLGIAHGGDVQATLSTGATSVGRMSNAHMLAFCFVPYPGKEPELGNLDEAALTQLLQQREAER